MPTIHFLGIIPARFASTRFPGKPLIDIGGKTMIHRVYERCRQVLEDVVVATDDERIFREVEKFGGEVLMTSEKHPSGTDRCAEALEKTEEAKKMKIDVVINIQGDEPFVRHDHIRLLKDCFSDQHTQIATLLNPVHNPDILENPNRVKVVVDSEDNALYFSRSVIPYIRNAEKGVWHNIHKYYQHVGMYAYRSDVLRKIVLLKQSSLEKAESLEQLRWLENGYKIKTRITSQETFCIDTPEDLDRLQKGGFDKAGEPVY